MINPNGDGPDQMPIDVQQMLVYLADLHAQQLAAANLEAAKWRTAAIGAQQRIAELTARVAELTAGTEPEAYTAAE